MISRRTMRRAFYGGIFISFIVPVAVAIIEPLDKISWAAAVFRMLPGIDNFAVSSRYSASAAIGIGCSLLLALLSAFAFMFADIDRRAITEKNQRLQ